MCFIPVSPKYNSLSTVDSYYCVRLVSNRECLAPVAGIAEHYESAEVSKDVVYTVLLGTYRRFGSRCQV